MTILGQSRAIEILSTALRSERFHHAWIFSGPRGVGKFTTAMQVARILLDPEAGDERLSDGANQKSHPQSNIQSRIDSQTHPDLHIIRKDLALFSDSRELRDRKQMNIPINLLRELIIGGKVGETYHEAPAYRTAQLGHGKVFIIDEAELLDPIGQNSMLKTLEEPPVQTYFVLITSQPDRLLATIRSRCQHVRFSRLDPGSMKTWLKQHASSLKPLLSEKEQEEAPPWKMTPDIMTWIEHFADGSPGAAQLAVEYQFINWQAVLAPMFSDLDRGKYPAAMGETMAKLVDDFALTWVKNHKNASKDAANKDGAKHLFSLLAAHLRDQLVARIERGDDASHVLEAIDLLRDSERHLETNVSLKLLLDNLVVQWSQAREPAQSLR